MKKLLLIVCLLLFTVAVQGQVSSPARPRSVPTKPGTPCSERDFIQAVDTHITSLCQNALWKDIATGSVGTGDVVGPASSTDNAAARFDSTTGKLLQNGLLTIDDSGSLNIPTGQSYKINNVALAKGNVGLGNVDNTSDANKPVSTAQQTALDLKANLASPALTGTPIAPTAAVDTNTTQLATTAYVIGQAYAKLASPVFSGNVGVGGTPTDKIEAIGGSIGTYHQSAAQGAGFYFDTYTDTTGSAKNTIGNFGFEQSTINTRRGDFVIRNANDGAPAEGLRFSRVFNLKIGGTAARGTTEGTNHIDLFNGTAPAGTLTNGASLFVTSGEMRTADAAGNITLISPHDHQTNEWIFFSCNTVTGKCLRVEMERMMRALDSMLGGGFVKEYASETEARPDLKGKQP